MKDSSIRYYSVVLAVNVDELETMYRENHPNAGDVSIEGMIEGELDWLRQSGISNSGALEEVFED